MPITLRTLTATGTFEVQTSPHADADTHHGVTLHRLALDKRYHGDLSAQASGQMLGVLTPQRGSAGYVAVERVTGTLHGWRGSFVLQHSGSLHDGLQQLAITIVPGSGTEELQGLSGQMRLQIAQGVHHYALDYRLPAATSSA